MSGPSHTYVALVDDDESHCRSLARLLRVAGIHPVTYASAEAFLADANRPRFDCLILDIQLSGLSGIELHEYLNAAGSAIPAIFLTALDEPSTRHRALRTGCSAYLRKTDSGEMLLEAVRRAIEPSTTSGKS